MIIPKHTTMNTAKFVTEITVVDPDSKGEVSLSVFKHDNGGMFALDSSYIEQVLPEDDECVIPDPFIFDPMLTEDDEGVVKLTGI